MAKAEKTKQSQHDDPAEEAREFMRGEITEQLEKTGGFKLDDDGKLTLGENVQKTIGSEVETQMRAYNERAFMYGGAKRPEWTKTADDGTSAYIELPLTRSKAITTNDATIGAYEEHLGPVRDERRMIPYIDLVRVLPTGGAVANFSKLSQLNFTHEANNDDEGRAKQGNVAAVADTHETYTAQLDISMPALDDIPMFAEVAQEEFIYAAQEKMADLILDAAVAKVADNGADKILRVKTGAAQALPTDVNIVGKLADVFEKLPNKYARNATWVVSRNIASLLYQAKTGADGDARIDLTAPLTSLMGDPLARDSGMPDGTTANDVSILYGDFRKAISLFLREALYLEYEKYGPNTMTFFGRFRLAIDVTYPAALVALGTAA